MYRSTVAISLLVAIITGTCKTQNNEYLQCNTCVSEVDYASRDPGCPISGENVNIQTCPRNFDRCISYRARNILTGKMVFRRHCANQKICKLQCLFKQHFDCEKSCCINDLCNDRKLEVYKVGTTTPRTIKQTILTKSTKTTAIIKTKIPSTPPPTKPNVAKSTSTTAIPEFTTTSNVQHSTTKKGKPTTQESITTTEQQVLGGPTDQEISTGKPNPNCRDRRKECPLYASYPAYCQYTRNFMLVHCPESCKFCERIPRGARTTPTTSGTTTVSFTEVRTTNNRVIEGPSKGCEDKRKRCGHFSNFDGYCGYHKGFMMTYCPLSCNFCDEVRLPESPTNPKTKEPAITKEPTSTSKTTMAQQETTTNSFDGEDLNDGCVDLRENCTFYATKYDGYCEYNKNYMEIYCPFSCGYCGTTSIENAFPHPPIFHYGHHVRDFPDFPAPPVSKDARWLTFNCNECKNGEQECFSKCIVILKDGTYEPTGNSVCKKLLGQPEKIIPC